jgi:tetratricopeptide (TPR) repeat protein/uncharacterized protein YgiM (DUF1202 family)
MKNFLRFALMVLSLFVLLFASVQAQEACGSKTVDEFRAAANDSYNQDDFESAAFYYSCAIELSPNDFGLYNSRGNAYFYIPELQDALADYNKAIELSPETAYLYFNRGNNYALLEDYELALADYNRCLELDSEHHLVHLVRGLLYIDMARYPEAIDDLNIQINIDPSFAHSYLSRAWAYLYNGDFALTHADFYRWIELSETHTITQSLDSVLAVGNLPIEEGWVYHLDFEGQAGSVYGFAALSDDEIDPLLVLLSPDGTAIVSDDDGGSNLNSVIRRFTLPETGTYTLILGQAGGYGTGEIELVVNRESNISSSNPENPNLAVSFASYFLYANEIAEVFTIGGDRLNLRSEPSLDAEIVDRLELGDLVTLLEGPYKEDGLAWWRVRNNAGIEGWAVERVESEQTLQLALFRGEEAMVMSAPDLLNVRETASLSSDVGFQLEDGAVVMLLDDKPVIADSLRWWHIRDSLGREGWAVDRIELERTLAPLREFPG